MITLTEDEKRMVFQLEGCHRYDAIQEIAVLCQYTRDHNKKATAENLLKKLRELSEDDCKELICDNFSECHRSRSEERRVGKEC